MAENESLTDLGDVLATLAVPRAKSDWPSAPLALITSAEGVPFKFEIGDEPPFYQCMIECGPAARAGLAALAGPTRGGMSTMLNDLVSGQLVKERYKAE